MGKFYAFRKKMSTHNFALMRSDRWNVVKGNVWLEFLLNITEKLYSLFPQYDTGQDYCKELHSHMRTRLRRPRKPAEFGWALHCSSRRQDSNTGCRDVPLRYPLSFNNDTPLGFMMQWSSCKTYADLIEMTVQLTSVNQNTVILRFKSSR